MAYNKLFISATVMNAFRLFLYHFWWIKGMLEMEMDECHARRCWNSYDDFLLSPFLSLHSLSHSSSRTNTTSNSCTCATIFACTIRIGKRSRCESLTREKEQNIGKTRTLPFHRIKCDKRMQKTTTIRMIETEKIHTFHLIASMLTNGAWN